jgi:predicted pyridoxine 5'-phosphate oxidase superfamily flavin-nucleotide-binding protein
MRNLISSPAPGIALLFVIPGLDETLRVNGRGAVVRDTDVLDRCVVEGRRPAVAIGVEVDEAFIHCAKAFRRGAVWSPDEWPDRADMPTIACMLRDHMALEDVSAEQIQAALDHSYTKALW